MWTPNTMLFAGEAQWPNTSIKTCKATHDYLMQLHTQCFQAESFFLPNLLILCDSCPWNVPVSKTYFSPFDVAPKSRGISIKTWKRVRRQKKKFYQTRFSEDESIEGHSLKAGELWQEMMRQFFAPLCTFNTTVPIFQPVSFPFQARPLPWKSEKVSGVQIRDRWKKLSKLIISTGIPWNLSFPYILFHEKDQGSHETLEMKFHDFPWPNLRFSKTVSAVKILANFRGNFISGQFRKPSHLSLYFECKLG